MPTTFTTGQIAKICHVTKRTVIKWIDAGRLRGYVLPESSHRRVTEEELHRFLRRHRIPRGPKVRRMPKILIVDDDRDFSELLKDALTPHYALSFAATALEAAIRLPQFEPDLILLDIRLPDVSGLEVCSQFREYCRRQSVPILAMSAYGKELDVDDLRRRGARAFFAKPVKLFELEKQIRSLVG